MAFVRDQLLKLVAYGDKDWRNSEEDFVCDLLSSLTLYRPYPAKFHIEMLKVLQDRNDGLADQGNFWRAAHTHMCVRISQEIQNRTNREVTDDMFSAMIESVSNLKLKDLQEVKNYVSSGIEWVLEEWQTTRAAFTDAIAVQVRRLDQKMTEEV